MAVPPADAQGRPDGFIIRRWKWEWSKNVTFSEGKLGTRHVKGTQPRPQGFSLKKWVGREKALASAGHVSPRTP